MADDEREAYLTAALPAGTGRSGADSRALRAQLPLIRRRGYALSLGGRVAGSRSLAMPVRTWRGDVLALVTSGPAQRFTAEAASGAVPLLRDIGRRLTQQPGGTG